MEYGLLLDGVLNSRLSAKYTTAKALQMTKILTSLYYYRYIYSPCLGFVLLGDVRVANGRALGDLLPPGRCTLAVPGAPHFSNHG